MCSMAAFTSAMMTMEHKSVGGVERVMLYPADAVTSALFSSEGCEVEFASAPLEVELLDDASHYEEVSECAGGASRVTHQLHLVAERGEAEKWLETNFLEAISIDGAVAKVVLADGRALLVGYSQRFGDEQPLRLERLISTSGTTLHDRPTITLRLVSHDTEFSNEII